jgi:Ion transport protein
MIYPDDDLKNFWDLVITVLLVFVCLVTPYRTALIDQEDFNWIIINHLIDFIFLVDIFFAFNTAYYDQDIKIIDDRKVIACDYMKSWFLLDLLSIIPFSYFVPDNSSGSDLSKISKLGRIYKLVKMTKLIRVLKVLK